MSCLYAGVIFLIVNFVFRCTKGMLVLEIKTHDENYAFVPCNTSFVFTNTRGRVDIRKPDFTNGSIRQCFCLFYPENDASWPSMWNIGLIITKDGVLKTVPEFWVTLRNEHLTNNFIHFKYNFTDSLPSLQIPSVGFRYLHEDRIFTFLPYKVSLDISCSPLSYENAMHAVRSTGLSETKSPVINGNGVITSNIIGESYSTLSYMDEGVSSTSSTNSRGRKGSNTTYIIIGVVSMVLAVFVTISGSFVYFSRKSGKLCFAHKNIDRNYSGCSISNSNTSQEDSVQQNYTVGYANVGASKKEEPNTEYVEIDISKLTRKISDNEETANNNNEPALTYADLNFDDIPKETENSQVLKTTNVEHSSRDKDVSELYAKPIKKPKSHIPTKPKHV